MRKYLAFLLTALLLILAVGCAGRTTNDIANRDQQTAEDSGMTIHRIGVATYNIQDPQVMMFKQYLDQYVKPCFTDVTFLYSDSISSSEEMAAFIQLCADNGAEGMMIFGSIDLVSEVELCAQHGMYVIRPSGTSSDAVFDAVADNPCFVGEIGPGAEKEYQAGAELARAMAGTGGSYLILSSGAAAGNEMHRLRTLAMLETLQEIHGITFPHSCEDLALTAEVTTIEADGITVTICPGYLERQENCDAAAALIASGEYTAVLSAVPVTPLMDALDTAKVRCGIIDCFSEDNYYAFQRGTISYVAGKYQSEIGPGFAALYNAITGNGELYREDGKAFRLEQGFWTAESFAEYDSMYALARGFGVNAYNYEDLYAMVKTMTPSADFQSFQALVAHYSYEDCLLRRSAK